MPLFHENPANGFTSATSIPPNSFISASNLPANASRQTCARTSGHAKAIEAPRGNSHLLVAFRRRGSPFADAPPWSSFFLVATLRALRLQRIPPFFVSNLRAQLRALYQLQMCEKNTARKTA
jgi:hypothetical protein